MKQSEVLSICSCAGEIIVQCTSVLHEAAEHLDDGDRSICLEIALTPSVKV